MVATGHRRAARIAEEQFRKAWDRGTELITQIYGSYGSRLHRDRDGRSRVIPSGRTTTRRAAFDRNLAYDEPETGATLLDAVAETDVDC